MLSAAPKNRRRRRRRQKRSVTAQNTADSNQIDVDDDESVDDKIDDNEKEGTFSPKVNSKFINEDVEIETAMLLKHLTKDTEFTLKKERAIEFFTSSLSARETKESKKRDEEKNVDEIEVMPPPDTQQENYQDGPQLALSYLNDEIETVVVPFDKQTTISFDEQQIYLPELSLPKEFPHDIEMGDAKFPRNLIEEGHFVKSKPNIWTMNRALFINRLTEEDALHWYDFDQKEIRDLCNITLSRRLIKTFCAEKFHPIDYPPSSICLELDAFSIQDRILKIHIKHIYFDVHPLFNSEQKLARELESLYDEYVAIKQNDILKKIETKLKILRQLLDTVSKSSKKQTTTDHLQIHRDELKELRTTWHTESTKYRILMQTILEKWAELKKSREGLTEPSTSLKLIIRARDPNVENDEYEWSQKFELEHREMLEEAQELYRKQKAQRKKSAKRGLKSEISIQNEDHENAPAEIVKPNAKKIEQELLRIFGASMRPPGEQIIEFDLENINTATMKSPPKYIVRLILDDGHLDFPESTKLNNVGLANLNAVYSIKFTTRISNQLKFQIFEKTNLSMPRRVAETLYQTPIETETFLPTTLSSIGFESQSGRKYAGKIVCSIGWASTDVEPDRLSIASQTLSKATPAQGTVGQWYTDQLIDPMDPDNRVLVSLMEKTQTTSNKLAPQQTHSKRNLFRLNEDTYAFCDRDKLNDNKRIELLNARFNSDLKLKDCKLVPHNEVEIEIPVDLKIFEDMLWVDPIDVQRYQGKKYLKHVYDIITNHCEVINRNYEHRDLLIGDTPPTLYGAIEAFTNIFSPRRPLNPHRKTLIRKSNFHEDRVNRFNIIINVVRASGIPYRNSNEVTVNRRTSLGSTMQNLQRHANVRPFVTATFRHKTLRTSTVDGSSPTWNEQIVIPINEGINQIKDSLWFHMYDEIIEDIPSNDNVITPTSEIYQKISSHYLGELLIPFSTIYASQRIEGTFEMITPLILLGYTKPAVNVSDHGPESNGGVLETRQSILISLLISIEPIIEITHFSTSHLECIELTAIKNRIGLWLSEITDEFPERAQDPLISLANGKRVCITRLIGAIDIPFERNETSEYMIRRFVSLIPIRPHKNVCTKLNGVWLTNDQILNILIASPKDLGVLLTCFYLSLGFNAYLVMGFAVPYGDTTFVLTKENNEYFLIDPHSGRKCSSRDTFCALMKVYCIVNPKNVWANIQREHRVFMQNFDTSQTTEWRELFTKSSPAPNDLAHDITLAYTDSLDCGNLKKSIETKIMKKFRSWRMERKTVWNKRYTEIMMQILKELEEDQCFGIEQKNYTSRLIESTQTKYKISGYPINMPYVSISKIIERVKATEIYLNSDQKVEFALAVHIQSYPMNIFSVWIFVLALTPTA